MSAIDITTPPMPRMAVFQPPFKTDITVYGNSFIVLSSRERDSTLPVLFVTGLFALQVHGVARRRNEEAYLLSHSYR